MRIPPTKSLNPNRPFSLMKDFAAVGPMNYADIMMVVNRDVEAKSLMEFIALAKAKPGQINYASSGIGTVYHMAGELLKSMATYRHRPRAASSVRGHAQQRARRSRADDV